MLLDPSKQELDLPAAFVKVADGDNAVVKVVGEEGDRGSVRA
jgi:hypothetical protein